MIHGVDPAIGNFVGAALKAQAINRLRSRKTADENSAIVFTLLAIGDVVEQKTAPLRFRYTTSELPAHQGLKLGVFINLFVNAVELIVALQCGDKLAQIFVGFGEIHRVFVYAFFSGLSSLKANFHLQK